MHLSNRKPNTYQIHMHTLSHPESQCKKLHTTHTQNHLHFESKGKKKRNNFIIYLNHNHITGHIRLI